MKDQNQEVDPDLDHEAEAPNETETDILEEGEIETEREEDVIKIEKLVEENEIDRLRLQKMILEDAHLDLKHLILGAPQNVKIHELVHQKMHPVWLELNA